MTDSDVNIYREVRRGYFLGDWAEKGNKRVREKELPSNRSFGKFSESNYLLHPKISLSCWN
jgi:hypothetical protein